MSEHYDVVIVGAGIAGSAFAVALSQISLPASYSSKSSKSSEPQSKESKETEKKLRVLLLERNLSEPHRIVGELLQPGGVSALQSLNLSSTLTGIGSIPVQGYAVVHSGSVVRIPYPDAAEGRSFHHGRFVQKLREGARGAEGVDVVEGAVVGLVECPITGHVIGVRARTTEEEGERVFFGDLTVVADGCFSNLRSKVIPGIMARATTKSHFCGLILDDVALPYRNHGTVCLIPGSGPVLLYQIEEHDTRILIDIKEPLPKDLKGHIEKNIVPHLPSSLQPAVTTALSKDRLQRMPNTFLPPSAQSSGSKEGVILLGDAWNMRHPLTGGGMTVALTDVVRLRDLLASYLISNANSSNPSPSPLTEWDKIVEILDTWHWSRKPLSSTINILSVALYDLFGADDEDLQVLRNGCFKYFELGGECIRGPVSLLSGITPSPLVLAYHFFSVAFYSIWVMFFHPRPVPSSSSPTSSNSSSTSSTQDGGDGKVVMRRPSVGEYPALVLRSFTVFWTACVVFGPLVWSEIRWW
ncbi:squalene monooxygenase [Sistotremastrum niveocremeum HHB9708]|uniref:Squalene monooxygenase n=1 Tax=Sistotremastrum niveocremeum HHB9708 TaxID=1314777 RepID=A0A164PWK9_9AGAM|nr:squalene monooxygenase [Sistotremastrum niveocremeum HHB9708]